MPQLSSKGLRSTPDAGERADAAGLHTEFGAEVDERLLHKADEVDGADASAAWITQAAQVEDGIADELAGAVVGDVATTIDFVEGDAAAREELIGCEDVGAVCIAAEGEHRRVFEEQQNVADAALLAEFDQLRLEKERFAVVDAAEIEVLDHRLL